MKPILRSVLLPVAVLALGCPTSDSAADDAGDLLKRADGIAERVVKLRGLSKKKAIKRGIMDKEAIRKRLLERVDEEYTPEELAAEELALKRLGLLAPTADYKKLVIDVFTEQIAGFYDPVHQQLYIADEPQGGPGVISDILMAHEIDHALQDQHFDLRRFMSPIKHENDASVARQALVEGDGTALMLEYMMHDMGMDMPWADSRTTDAMIQQMSAAVGAGNGLDKVPMVLREGMLFPYMSGLAFVANFRKHHPWTRVDAVFKKPPLSTEHILHPEKYDAYERPVVVSAGAMASLPKYVKAYDNVNGEFGLYVLLRQHAGGRPEVFKEKAERATAGWGGDRIAVYTPPGYQSGVDGAIAVLYTVWDQEADAIEFFELLSDCMASLSGGQSVEASDNELVYQSATGQETLAERHGTAVVIVLGAAKDKSRAIASDAWKTWKVKRR